MSIAKMNPKSGSILTERFLEWFHHDSLEEWGYDTPQTDSFAVLHPKNEQPGVRYPLYVVFHSAGHDLYSTVGCTWQPGNHDIYHAPEDMFALYLDCRQHEGDWWWGGNSDNKALRIMKEERMTTEPTPVEKRSIATVEWVIENYAVDANRVYAVGNSMGGTGALGIAMCRGDIFAAVKANVPAGVRHISDRCCLDKEAPEGFKLPDPPILVDYSGQNDGWSQGHQILYRAMREKKYAVLGYWAMFGHANNHSAIRPYNDLIHSFDIFAVRRDEAYPVFTNATTDDVIPWQDDNSICHEEAGQINSFFRWDSPAETDESISITLRLLRQDEWESTITFPTESTADVSFRRLQKCHFAPAEVVSYTYGDSCGTVTADENGLVTIPSVRVTTTPLTLTVTKK